MVVDGVKERFNVTFDDSGDTKSMLYRPKGSVAAAEGAESVR